jgi:hypothetical protein
VNWLRFARIALVAFITLWVVMLIASRVADAADDLFLIGIFAVAGIAISAAACVLLQFSRRKAH